MTDKYANSESRVHPNEVEGCDGELMEALSTVSEKGHELLADVMRDGCFTPLNAILLNVCNDSEALALVVALYEAGAISLGSMLDFCAAGISNLRDNP